MRIESETLIQDLINQTQINLNQAEKFNLLSEDVLNGRITQDSWRI